MPYRTKEPTDSPNKEETNHGGSYMDSEFIPLDDLVYAPLHALAQSNLQLRAKIVDSIRSMGTVRQSGQEETIHLNNINIAYDQIRTEAQEGYSVDNLQVQIPLLSIVPVTNLNVEKATLDYSTEVKAVVNEENKEIKLNARICAPQQREGSFLPRVSYKIHVSSIPATEGIMRLIDALSANQVAKKLDTTPIAVSGDLGSEDQKNIQAEIKNYRTKITRLKQLYQKVSDMIGEQERLYQISKDAFAEDTYEFDKDKYLMAQSNIVNRIMTYEEKIMNMEILYGLEKDYK